MEEGEGNEVGVRTPSVDCIYEHRVGRVGAVPIVGWETDTFRHRQNPPPFGVGDLSPRLLNMACQKNSTGNDLIRVIVFFFNLNRIVCVSHRKSQLGTCASVMGFTLRQKALSRAQTA